MTDHFEIVENLRHDNIPHVSRIITSEQSSESYCDDILAQMLNYGTQEPCVVKADFSQAFLFSSIITSQSNVEYMLETNGGYTGLEDQDTRLPLFMLKAKNRLIGYYIDAERPKISFYIDVDSAGIVTFSQERPVTCHRFNNSTRRASFSSDTPLILLRSSLKFRNVNFISHQIDITKHFNFKNNYPVIITDHDFQDNYYELNNDKTIII